MPTKEDRQRRPPPISRYLNIRKAYHPSFSSDGERLVFLSDITGVPQVWQVELSAHRQRITWLEQRTFEPDRVLGVWCSPAPGDERLIYSADIGGSENAQLFLLHNDGTPDLPLTLGHEGALHIFGEWSTDGSHILFAANRRHPGLFDLYLQPIDGQAQRVWQNDKPGYLFSMKFSPDGKRAIISRVVSSFQHDIFEVDLDTKIARQLNPPELIARYDPLWFGQDGSSLYVSTDRGSDFLHIARLDLETCALETLVSSDWDLEFLTCAPNGDVLAYAVNVNGAYEIQVLDLASGGIRRAPSIGNEPGVVAVWDRLLDMSPDSARLAFSFTSATRTSDIFLWDLKRDVIDPVTQSSHGGIPRDDFIAPQLVRYATFDEREIPAWFYSRPEEGDKLRPVIVFVHGGPESQFKPYFHFFLQYFIQRGFAVLAPNVRGSTGYGKHFAHLDDVEKRMDSVRDLAYAAYWLRQQAGIDGDRLVVYGGSYGGFMVLAALTQQADLWAAGVNIVGISNFVTFLENTSEYRRSHREAEYGSLEEDRDFLESISPLNHAHKIVSPLMVIHGANDPRVPLSEAKQLVEMLESRDVPVEFIVFEDEGHGLVKLKNKLVAYPAIAEFLTKHLPE